MFNSFLKIFLLLQQFTKIVVEGNSNQIIPTDISSTYQNKLIITFHKLIERSSMVPFAKVIGIMAIAQIKNKQLMNDISNTVAKVHQKHFFQYVELTVDNMYLLNGQRHAMMMFDEIGAMRY